MRCVNAAHDPVPGSGTPRPEGRARENEAGETGARLRILLVEDNPDVLRSTTRLLERLGHVVVVAVDGAEALDRAAGGDEIDLLVTDVLMPRLGGVELVARLRERNPHLPVVLMTGFPGADPDGRALDGERTVFLQKPFGAIELADALAALAPSD